MDSRRAVGHTVPGNRCFLFSVLGEGRADNSQRCAMVPLGVKKSRLCRLAVVAACAVFVLALGTARAEEALSEMDKIIGGTDADIADYPWFAQLWEEGRMTCGATLITESWAVTAAHCAYEVEASDLQLKLGCSTPECGDGTTHSVAALYLHEGYNPTTMDNDIALLKLSVPSDRQSLPLADSSELEGLETAGTMTRVIGWGLTSQFPAEYPEKLQEVDVPIVDFDTANGSSYYAGTLTQNMLAAGFLGVGGKDSCSGDSGGPLVVSSSGWQLVGLVSWGYGCADPSYPGIYTRVSRYASWAENIITPPSTPVPAIMLLLN